MTAKRRRAERRGRWAEWAAELLLRLKGYTILARRARLKAGELDLVARKGGTLAIIEVKARKTLEQAAESVSFHQRKRIERAAANWRAARPAALPLAIRYDLFLFAPWQWPDHRRAAWIPEGRESFDYL